MFCENCGNKLEEGSKFCTRCGAKVEYNNQTQNTSSVNSINSVTEIESKNNINNTSTQNFKKNKQKKSSGNDKKIVVGIVIFLIVLIIGGIVVAAIIKNNIKNAVKNTLGVFEQTVYDVTDTLNEEKNKEVEVETKLNWSTPFLKIDKEDSTVKDLFIVKGISDLTNYEVYGAIINVEFNASNYVLSDIDKEIKSDEFVVAVDKEIKAFDDENEKITSYVSIYIAVKPEEKVENIKLYYGEQNDKVLNGIENNVQVKNGTYQGKATYGDCLKFSFTETNTTTYLVLVDMEKYYQPDIGYSSIYPGEKYESLSARIGYIYITDKDVKAGELAQYHLNFDGLFKTSIEDSRIIATSGDEIYKNEEEVFVDGKIFIYRSGAGNFDIKYIYKRNSKTIEEAQKIFKNKSLKLKLLGELEVEIIK